MLWLHIFWYSNFWLHTFWYSNFEGTHPALENQLGELPNSNCITNCLDEMETSAHCNGNTDPIHLELDLFNAAYIAAEALSFILRCYNRDV
jgi:hypothetical protein